MFTGIIEKEGKIQRLEKGRLSLAVSWNQSELQMGESISVDGCCLTVVSAIDGEIEFDLSPETLERTTFSRRPAGSRVNLERALRSGGAIGGHMITGHIDTVVRIASIEPQPDGSRKMWIATPQKYLHWVVEKGSVAIDGVSLTVNAVGSYSFSVMLIPHTLGVTTLGERKTGDWVNVEFDLMAKYVWKYVQHRFEERQKEIQP